MLSIESVRISFTYAALNGINFCAADINNEYLQTTSLQKYYIIFGPEFGPENVVKVALIHRYLYVIKSKASDFRKNMRYFMRYL